MMPFFHLSERPNDEAHDADGIGVFHALDFQSKGHKRTSLILSFAPYAGKNFGLLFTG